MLSEISHPKEQILSDSHLYKVPRIVKFIKTEKRIVVTRGIGRGGELLFNGFRISI